jgi:hypothetical protein
VSVSTYIALSIGCLMNNELEKMWKETAVTYFRAISQHYSGRTEENF